VHQPLLLKSLLCNQNLKKIRILLFQWINDKCAAMKKKSIVCDEITSSIKSTHTGDTNDNAENASFDNMSIT
jgi:hypothetical protein